ncbi:hypothetical protein SESBI_13671 [Sesbania bispinosa]|nr:hypothetical protein SESBI_13671 [Sesbania bispinosa]
MKGLGRETIQLGVPIVDAPPDGENMTRAFKSINPKPSKPPSILFLTPPRPKTHRDVACAKERRRRPLPKERHRRPPSTAKGTSPSRKEDPLLAAVLTVDAVAGGENTVVVLAEGTSSSPLPLPALFVALVAVEP